MLRLLTLRVLGLAVGVLLTATAVQFLAYSFGVENRLLDGTFGFMERSASAVISEGGLMLAGVVLLGIAGIIAFVVLTPERSRLISLTDGASTRAFLGPSSLARSVQRSLRADVDSEVAVRAKGKRLVATVPYRGVAQSREVSHEVASRMSAELEARGMTKLGYRVEIGRPSRRRVR